LNLWNDMDMDFDRPTDWMEDFRRRMDRMFDELDPFVASSELFRPGTLRGGAVHRPRVTLDDKGTEFLLYADVPGVDEHDLEITLQGDTVTVSGQRRPDIPDGYRVHRQERAPIQFTRSLSLPAKVEGDKVEAVLSDGILTLRIPKAQEAQPRQITVKAA
jgi:HSP20 family protein